MAEFISSTPVETVCTFLLTCSDAADATQPQWLAAYEKDLARIVADIDRSAS